MPVYNYKALKSDGAVEAGVIDADSPKDARLKLRDKRLHVTDLDVVGQPGQAVAPGAKAPSKPGFWRRRRLQDLGIITRQLGTLLGSGIPMMGSMSALIEQVEDRHLKTALLSIREQVSQGASLSDSMAQHPFYFNDLYVNMVRAGEASGHLDKVLFRLADYIQKQHRLRAKIGAAMTYPAIMVIIGTIVVSVLLGFVVPQILEGIRKQKKDAVLPLPTQILVVGSDFVKGYWWLILLGIAGLFVLYRSMVRTPAGRLWVDTAKLDMPIFGQLLRKSAISRFSVTFATLLESGLPVLDSLNVVKRVVDNAFMSKTLDAVRQKIIEGADIATPMKASKVFPPVVGYMIAVGEETGRLEDLLKRIAESYDEEVEIAAQRMTAMLEPIMIVLMAVVVGFIVLAILLPIIQMSNV